MKKFLVLILLSVFIYNFAYTQAKTYDISILPRKAQKVTKKFIEAVQTHNYKKFEKCFDKKYLEEQYDLSKPSEIKRFKSEIFCGNTDNNAFKCLYFNDITSIKFLYFISDALIGTEIYFQAIDKNGTKVTFSLTLSDNMKKLIGAYG